MREHRHRYSLDKNNIREEIKKRKRLYENREERKRLVREIVLQENESIACTEDQASNTPVHSSEQLEEDMLQDNQKYLETIELGKQVNCARRIVIKVSKRCTQLVPKAKTNTRYDAGGTTTVAARIDGYNCYSN